MKVCWIALVSLAACASPTSHAATSSGGERAEPRETASAEGAETGNALGDPPATPPISTTAGATAETGETGETGESVETESTVTAETPQPATPRPTTILAPARSGRLRLSDVHEVIQNHRPEVTSCYEEGLARDRSLAGEAKVRFLIGPRGRIEDAEVYESSLGDDVVEECIVTAMRGWRFPRPRPRGSSVLLTYPYSLSTE